MVLLKPTILPTKILESVENDLKTFVIKYEKNNESKEESVELLCEIPNIENITKITHLDLTNCCVKEFPKTLEVLQHLLVLNISHNLLSNVPKCLENDMEKIQQIDLSFNQIGSFDFIPACVLNLTSLNINHNMLKAIPKWLHKATNLYKLDIGDNPFIEDDNAIKTITSNLKHLNISNCNIPIQSLSMLDKYPELTYLDISSKHSDEQLEILPIDDLVNLPKLTTLVASHSKLQNVTDINLLNNLTTINFETNHLEILPTEFCQLVNLEDCKLSRNLIKELPEEIFQLKNLRKLHLDHNLLISLPDTISEMPNLELLDVYNNVLKEVPQLQLLYFDMAKNDINELDSEKYMEMKSNLRKLYGYNTREDGRLTENEVMVYRIELDEESEHDLSPQVVECPIVDEEDWESDSEWEPTRNNVWDSKLYSSHSRSKDTLDTYPGVPGQFDD